MQLKNPIPNQKTVSQPHLLEQHKRQNARRLKWITGCLLVIIVAALVLLLGSATDWTTGLRKTVTKDGTPVSNALDSLRTKSETEKTPASDTPLNTNGDTTTNTNSTKTSTDNSATDNPTSPPPNNVPAGGGTNNSNDTNNGSGDGNSGNNANGKDKKDKKDNKNKSTKSLQVPLSPADPQSALLSLYGSSSAGNNIDDVLHNATQLGISGTCSTQLLVQTCTFTQGSNTVTIKNLLGTGIVTSVIKNF